MSYTYSQQGLAQVINAPKSLGNTQRREEGEDNTPHAASFPHAAAMFTAAAVGTVREVSFHAALSLCCMV